MCERARGSLASQPDQQSQPRTAFALYPWLIDSATTKPRLRSAFGNCPVAGTCQIKDLATGTQEDVPLEDDAGSIVVAVRGILGS